MDSYGALVGWEHQELGDRIFLSVQSVQTVASAEQGDIDIFRLLMTRQQAGILGEYLLKAAGQQRNRKERGWFRRLFG